VLGSASGEGDAVGPDGVVALVGGQQAERREDAAGPWNDDVGHAQSVGQRGGEHRARAAEGREREPARVVALFDRHPADRAGHRRAGDADDAAGRRDRTVETGLRRQVDEDGVGSVGIECQALAERGVGAQVAQRERRASVTVGSVPPVP